MLLDAIIIQLRLKPCEILTPELIAVLVMGAACLTKLQHQVHHRVGILANLGKNKSTSVF